MVWWYRCSRIIQYAFRHYKRKASIPTNIVRSSSSSSRISQFSPPLLRNLVLQNVLKNNQRFKSPFVDGAKRFYYVDTNKVHHFKPRGFENWIRKRRNVIKLGFFGLLGFGAVVPLYLSNSETVPFTNRSRFVIVSTSLEKRLTESWMKMIEEYFEGKIVPPLHPQSVRLQRILDNIVVSAPKGMKLKEEADQSVTSSHEGEKSIRRMSSWMMKWFKRRSKFADLEGFKWEIILINDPSVNAFCWTGGKIFVYTGLLDHFKEDYELATVIGHEVGHAVARHAAEHISKDPWLGILIAIDEFITKEEWAQTFIVVILDQFYQYFFPDFMLLSIISGLFLGLPFCRRMEKEADYIGILLTAAAGYDPRLVPKVYEKFGSIRVDLPLKDYISTHPSAKKRVELLSQPKVMEEALSLYEEPKAEPPPPPQPHVGGFAQFLFRIAASIFPLWKSA